MTFLESKKFDYFILIARFLLGWTMLSYGWSKTFGGGQFGITEDDMLTPIGDLSLFRVGWYLFEHEPFNTFISISEMVCGLAIILNRTVLFGALFFIPICLNILVIDLTIMPNLFKVNFTKRLVFYLLLDALILYHYRDRMMIVWYVLKDGIKSNFKYKWTWYLLLPLFAILLEFIPVIPELIWMLIQDPDEFIRIHQEFLDKNLPALIQYLKSLFT